MKKEELEAILGDGDNTPDLGPIEEHLHAVATEPKLPDFAVGMCAARIEEAAPKLRAVLLRGCRWQGIVGRRKPAAVPRASYPRRCA